MSSLSFLILTGYVYAKHDVLQNDALARTNIVSVVNTVIHRDHAVIMSVMTVTKSYLWIIIDDIHLYDSDKMILESREWLNDRLIHAAQQLLLNNFPHISGLQSPIIQCTRTFEIHREKEFIQCLNQGGNHWIMVSSIACSRNTVRIHDSLNLQLSPTIVEVIAEFLHT